MSSVKKLCICAICVALCYVLPPAFHLFALGSVFSPMHIPVLLCGLICGGAYGAACGIAGPLLSSLLSGTPPAAMLIYMVPELCAYGLVSGLLMQVIPARRLSLQLYAALIPAMVVGRVVGGLARALFYATPEQPYSLALWFGGYFAGSLPGIVLHLILVPALVATLTRARLISAPAAPGRACVGESLS